MSELQLPPPPTPEALPARLSDRHAGLFCFEAETNTGWAFPLNAGTSVFGAVCIQLLFHFLKQRTQVNNQI